jgi:cell division protein FtsB
MDDQFYRTIQPKRWLRDIAHGAAKNKRRTAVLALLVFLALYLLFDNKGLLKRIRLESKRQELIDQVRADSVEAARLRAQIKALEGDQKTVEKIAREKYGMARPGETVYKTKKEEKGK